ncbi:MAG: 16S rRNA (guanine(527)-N(7))-methyltransferase RsmG [Sphingomonadaceae bacterium]
MQAWCSAEKIAKIEQLIAMLRDENERQNLVSRGSLDHVWERHIVDSAQLLTHVPRETWEKAGALDVPRGTVKWLDLGTGAGFPGLVIAVLCPEFETILVESRARRVEWLERAAGSLGLDKCRVEGKRLELVQGETVDVISARAFAPLPKLLDLSARFSTATTTWLLPKGRSAAQELRELTGWRHLFHVEHSLTDPESGIIVGTVAGRKGKRS